MIFVFRVPSSEKSRHAAYEQQITNNETILSTLSSTAP